MSHVRCWSTFPRARGELPLATQLLRPRRHNIYDPRRERALHTNFAPVPPPPTPRTAAAPPPPPAAPLAPCRSRCATRVRARVALPPEVARDPHLDAAAHACRRADRGPCDDGARGVAEDSERELRCGPADALQCQKAHERRERWVVEPPPS